VRDGVRELVGVRVAVPVRVAVRVRVKDRVDVAVRVVVGVRLGEEVRVGVPGVSSLVAVALGVAVGDPVAVAVPGCAVAVGVGVDTAAVEVGCAGVKVTPSMGVEVAVGLALGEVDPHPSSELRTLRTSSLIWICRLPSASIAIQDSTLPPLTTIPTPRMSSLIVTWPLPSQSPTHGIGCAAAGVAMPSNKTNRRIICISSTTGTGPAIRNSRC